MSNGSISNFTGAVYELSFDARLGQCQARLRNASANLTTNTLEHRIQTLLETALIKSLQVTVQYEPDDDNKLVAASINIDGP